MYAGWLCAEIKYTHIPIIYEAYIAEVVDNQSDQS